MLKRSRLFALLALLCVGLIAGCGGGDDDSGGGGGSGSKSDDPAALLEKALSAQVESGELELKGSVDVEGSRQLSGPVTFSMSGPFQSRGKAKIPLVDWDISFSGAGQSLQGGIVATDDNAFVKFRGQTYEVGTQLYRQFVEQQEKQASSGPQSLKDLGIDPAKWIEDPKVSDGESIGGDSTQKITGEIDTERMVNDLLDAAKSPAIRKQLESQNQQAPDISAADRKKVVDAVEDASFTVNVDDKDVARKAALSVTFDAPEGNTDGATGGKVSLEYELPKVGGDADIKAPSGAKPLSLLLQQFGLGGAGMPGGGLRTQ